MCLFYLYANAKIEIHICSNKHETGLVDYLLKMKRECFLEVNAFIRKSIMLGALCFINTNT